MSIPQLVERTYDNKLVFNFHVGQTEAWLAEERIVAIVAGSQAGKTTFGPLWLHREMQRKGPGAYLVAAPTDPLLQVKLIPAFKELFVDHAQLGTFSGSPRPHFILSPQGELRLWGKEQTERTIVYFGYAAKPDSLESMTALAAWLDEAGQPDFKVGSWEAIQRRVAIHQGRILITTTPYVVGHWLKRRVFDRRTDKRNSIKVVKFRSIDNPAFPRESWENAKRDMPGWKFRMMYCGEFSRPAGQIYDIFDDAVHVVPRFALAERWPRYLGLDFGGVNTYGTFIAENPQSKDLYIYRTYHAGNRTAAQHTAAILKPEPRVPLTYGGAKSEQQWRDEFKAAGLPVKEPATSDVEIGIDRVYAQYANQRLFIFDDLDSLIDEHMNYSRPVDDEGNALEGIVDKSLYHGLDSLRYVIGSIRGGKAGSGYVQTVPSYEDEELIRRQNAYYGR